MTEQRPEDEIGTGTGEDATTSEAAGPVVDPDQAALGTRNLTRQFGELTALDSVELGIPREELRAVIGPNGAGKTTLFNVLTDALSPSAGTVYFDGNEITDVSQHERPHMGLVRSFQSNQLFTEQTVIENVRIVAQTAEQGSFSFNVFRDGRRVARERAYEILDAVGLDALADEEAKNLSHGDQRRLGIAMALATEPEVLLLDEPTSGLGSAETEETAALIESLQDDLGFTLLLIEHDMDVVLAMSDRITVLHRGQILATGTTDEIQNDDRVQEAYLGGRKEEF
jgi:branched-chain amino acid transport system ATP-binding protein